MRTVYKLTQAAVLLLALCLLFAACAEPMQTSDASVFGSQSRSETTEEAAASFLTQIPTNPSVQTEKPEPTALETEPQETMEEALIRWQNGGLRDYLPDAPVQMIPFSEMQYVRPNTVQLFSDFDALTAQAQDAQADTLLAGYFDLFSRYISFETMYELSWIRYSLDTTDADALNEYNACEAEANPLEEKLERLLKAFAASPCRGELEKQYFGEGFFQTYDDMERYTNPEYLRLLLEEDALLAQFREITADPQVTYQNKTESLDDWRKTEDYDTYWAVMSAYYQQYHEALGSLFIQLIRVRQQLASALGFESYADYAYAISYDRAYTPEEGRRFLREIRDTLVPVYRESRKNRTLRRLRYEPASQAQMQEMLASAAEQLGGTISDAWRFMTAYDLFDISASDNKLEVSYQTYLHDYEAPFVFVNAYGTEKNYLTFAHEFGHFVENYYNYGISADLETNETFSMAMEYLALESTQTLTEQKKDNLRLLRLCDTAQTFAAEACSADFEMRVYEIDADTLTPAEIDALYWTCCAEYGMDESLPKHPGEMTWCDQYTFYEAPFYVISYCVSAETSLQIAALEMEQSRAGVEAYLRLLDRDDGIGIQQVMENAGLKSPFADGALENAAKFLRRELYLDS